MDYFIIYKPYGFLSQFTKEADHHQTLADLDHFPKDVYSVGRLDRDSEGLLILTNDKKLNNLLLHPKNKHQRTYLVQVEGIPTPEAIQALQKGLIIRINKKDYQTLPAQAIVLDNPPELPDRDPPIRFRATIPTSWIQLTLTEGKNRQVRRMCAKIGFPVLRLVRYSIEDLNLHQMAVGQVKPISKAALYPLLKLRT